MSKSSSSHFKSNQAQVKTSKKLSSALRHQAENMKLSISADGYVDVQELLRHSQFRGVTFQQVEECVLKCQKQRFQLKTNSVGVVFIRATQGHSISSVKDGELLELIGDPASIPVCQHGTYACHIDSIRKTGLNRMRRNNIHLIACLPSEEDEVVSGMRKSADTIVTIDVAGAMAAGIPFFRSSNGVILSPGLGDTGCIPPEFISQILQRGAAPRTSTSTLKQAVTETTSSSTTVVDIEDNTLQQQQQHQPLREESPEESSSSSSSSVSCAQSVFACDLDSSLPSSTPTPSTFTHYCVIDFEATCLDNKQMHPQEIIEFPAVMLSAATLEVVSEFHSYVRPVHHPVLSSFCTSLTGIAQETVDGAPDFTVVFQRFHDFLEAFQAQYREEHEGKEEPCVLFASHGDWDFLTMLPNQCKTSHLQVPAALTRWMNVKVLYTNSEPAAGGGGRGGDRSRGGTKGLGMAAMLAQLGLELRGRHHSGIDDTRNIARIVVELVTTRGAVPLVTSELHNNKYKNNNQKNSSGKNSNNSHYSRSQTRTTITNRTQHNTKKKNTKSSFTFV